MAISPVLRATVYRYLAAFAGFLALGILAQPKVGTLTDLWHAAGVALPLAIEKFMATKTNAQAHAQATVPAVKP